MATGHTRLDFHHLRENRIEPRRAPVAREERWRLLAGGLPLAEFACTPRELRELAFGYLLNEARIRSPRDIRRIQVDPERRTLKVGLARPLRLSTEPLPTLPGGPRVRPADLHRRMEDLLQGAHIYRAARGVHSSALATPRKVLRIAEDIGKYNTLDKLRGWNALRGRPQAPLLLTTGRLTAGMVSKGLRMGTSILATIGGTTAEGVRLARDHNATLVGYLRGDSMNLYSRPERIIPPRDAGKGHG